MKPFDLNEAKAGKPVCTRSGRKARIVCFEAKTGMGDNTHIVSIVTENDGCERIFFHDRNGECTCTSDTEHDLMMCEATDTLPKSWEEFCDSYPIECGECYIGEGSTILKRYDGLRGDKFDKNLFRTKEQAEAMLAFIQLIRLRDVYRQGWEPDWGDDKIKYCIVLYNNYIAKNSFLNNTSRQLSFQSTEIRDKFLENFRELIETAKEFI